MPPPTALPPSGFFCWLVGPWFPQHQLQDWNPTNSGHPSRHPRSVPVVWRQIWRWVAKKPKCLGRNSYFKWGLNNAYRFRRVCWSYLKATFDVTGPSLLLRVHLFTQTLVVAGALCGRTHGMDVTIKGILRIHPAAVTPLLAHSWQANWEDTTKTSWRVMRMKVTHFFGSGPILAPEQLKQQFKEWMLYSAKPPCRGVNCPLFS